MMTLLSQKSDFWIGLDFFISPSLSREREREKDERWSRRGTREARARARSATGECSCRRAFFC